MKYQEIEERLRGRVDPQLLLVIQHIHAENVGLKQEITGICKGMDRLVETMNSVLTVAHMHNLVFKGMEDGKSFSDVVSGLRAEHVSGIESEKVE